MEEPDAMEEPDVAEPEDATVDVAKDTGDPLPRPVLRGGCACDVPRATSAASPRAALALAALAVLRRRRRG